MINNFEIQIRGNIKYKNKNKKNKKLSKKWISIIVFFVFYDDHEFQEVRNNID